MVRTPGRFKDVLMPIKTSAIWLTKNSVKFIGYSILSVLCFVDQAIIIDDDSTDETKRAILSIKSPKIQFSSSNPAKYDMDWNIRYGLSHASGEAVIFLDDDYIWDNYNASQMQGIMQQAKQQGKWGVDLTCYNIMRPGQHLPPAKNTPDLVFQMPGNHVIVGGSFYTDNNQLVHRKEAHGFTRLGKHHLNKKCENYFQCGIGFSHWKYVKDTKEEFMYKLGLFLQMTPQEAEDDWNKLQARETLPYPYAMPEVFYEYRDQFVPLGGFDIVKWTEECQRANK